ncbi:MAG: ribosomal protein N(5)-glutamine methyltransferase [Pseudomonadota bacterium]|jgi:ribosomal protein L3 glutamine methyltransferase
MNHSSMNSVQDELLTLRDFIRWSASCFNEAGLFFGHGTATALDEAAALVLYALSLEYTLPETYFSARLTRPEKDRIVAMVEERVRSRVPLAYLTHEAWFCGLRFYVDERVLVPRSPIAELIENRFQPWIAPDAVTRVLDLCTGSGCIAIACAYAFPEAEVHAVDISSDALAVARRNIADHDLEMQVQAVESDLFNALEGQRYDLIVSNPPYVNLDEWQSLPDEFHAEPALGLAAGEDGLDIVRRMLAEVSRYLTPEGILVVEVGSSADMLQAAYPDVPFWWIDFERGGDGVFMLTAAQIHEYHQALQPLEVPTNVTTGAVHVR